MLAIDFIALKPGDKLRHIKIAAAVLEYIALTYMGIKHAKI